MVASRYKIVQGVRLLKPDTLVFLALAAWWVLNLLQAAFTGLADDEGYYWYFSQHLDWGYFDHPPMVALLVWLSSWLPGGLGVRFFATLLQPLYLWLFWRLIRPSDATYRDAVAYFLICFSQPLLQLYGFLAVPDAPLMMFTVLFLWAFKRFDSKSSIGNALQIQTEDDTPLYCARFRFEEGTPAEFQFRIQMRDYRTFRLLDSVGLILRPDPEKAPKSRTIELNETFRISGQTFTFTKLELSMLELKLTLLQDEANTATLRSAIFTVTTEDGRRLECGPEDLYAVSHGNGEMTYFLESPFFYDCRELTLEFDKAIFSTKGKDWICVDLEAGTAENLADYYTLVSTEREETGWRIVIRNHDPEMAGLIRTHYFDGPGLLYTSHEFVSYEKKTATRDGESFEEITLRTGAMPGTTLWLQCFYDQIWQAEGDPVRVVLPLTEE